MSLTASQILEELGISRSTLTNYLEAGCPHTRKGKGPRAPLRFELEAVKAWMHDVVLSGSPGYASRAPAFVDRSEKRGRRRRGEAEGTAAPPAPSRDRGPRRRDSSPDVSIVEPGPEEPPPELEADQDQDLEDLEALSLVDLTRKVNIKIKRLEVAKRERLEAQAAGELVPLEDVRRAWLAQIEIVQARFRALPAIVATRLVGKEYDAIRDALEDELRATLRAFAREDIEALL